MRDCPQCGVSVDGLLCRSCGYHHPGFNPNLDPLRHTCVNVDRGHRCAKPGSLSPDTHGNGPWYCADHYPSFRSMLTRPSLPPAGFSHLRAILKQSAPDPETKAEREAIQGEAG